MLSQVFWKQLLKQGFDRDICVFKGFLLNHEGEEMNVNDMTSRMIYRFLIKKIQKAPTSQKRYSDDLNVNDAEWKDIYLMLFKSCFDVRTRMFQYKINLRCLMTNSRLYKMNIVDTEMCSHCNSFPETYQHLVLECIHAARIWRDFKFWYEENCHMNIGTFSFKTILFGLGVSEFDKLINLCFILVKKVIYDGRFRNQVPSIAAFKHLIKFHYTLEKQIAVSNNNMVNFINKWNVLEVYCNNDI